MLSAPELRLPIGTVTFFFTDVEGSTRLLSALGDEFTALLAVHDRLLREAIAGHGGTEVRTEGMPSSRSSPRRSTQWLRRPRRSAR